MRGSRVLLVAVGLVATQLVPTSSANAYPAATFSCNRGPEIRYEFKDGSASWSNYAAEKTIVLQGVDTLEDELDYDGDSYFDIGEATAADDDSVVIELIAENTAAYKGQVGSSGCDIQFGVLALNNNQEWIKVIRHEMGHAVGMEHGGAWDNQINPGGAANTIATMGSCEQPASWNSGKSIGKDQAQYVQYLENPKTNTQLTANGGFESGVNFFGYNNMTVASSPIDHEGDLGASLTASAFAYNSYISQNVTYWRGNASVKDLRNRYWIREIPTTNATLTKTRIAARKLTDSNPNIAGCSSATYPNGLDEPNAITAGSTWVVIYDNSVADVTGGFVARESPWRSPNIGLLSGFRGLRIQMKIYGRSLTTSNQSVPFFLDNARLESK